MCGDVASHRLFRRLVTRSPSCLSKLSGVRSVAPGLPGALRRSVEAQDRLLDLLASAGGEAAVDADAPKPGLLEDAKRACVVGRRARVDGPLGGPTQGWPPGSGHPVDPDTVFRVGTPGQHGVHDGLPLGAAGVDDQILKPVEPDSLVSVIDRYIPLASHGERGQA